jgi:hypothetical protein
MKGLRKVDRLTTGRRHVRAGSVSVTELITKQAARPESPSPVPAETTVTIDVPSDVPGDMPGEPETGPTSHRRPSPRGAQLAKITSLGVATIVLCGAVGIASTIAHQRQHDPETADRAGEQINGEQALLPGQLDRTLTPRGAKAATPPRPAPVTRTTRHTVPAAPRTTATARTAAAAPHSPAVVAPESDLDVVRRFYAHLPADPTVAFGLISPDLLHSTLGQFLDSWSLVRSVDVLQLREQADGVLVVVRMGLADGGHLQLQQLLTVAESPRRIVGVRLLSAQRN